jgi:hypothetical protein
MERNRNERIVGKEEHEKGGGVERLPLSLGGLTSSLRLANISYYYYYFFYNCRPCPWSLFFLVEADLFLQFSR